MHIRSRRWFARRDKWHWRGSAGARVGRTRFTYFSASGRSEFFPVKQLSIFICILWEILIRVLNQGSLLGNKYLLSGFSLKTQCQDQRGTALHVIKHMDQTKRAPAVNHVGGIIRPWQKPPKDAICKPE